MSAESRVLSPRSEVLGHPNSRVVYAGDRFRLQSPSSSYPTLSPTRPRTSDLGLRTWLLLALIGWLLPLAAADQPSVTVEANPAQVAVGSPVDITVTYRWPPGWSGGEPDPTEAFSDCFVVDLPPPEAWKTAEGSGRRWKLRCLSQASGTWALPQPVFTAQGPDGPVTVTAAAVVVNVGAEAAAIDPAPPRPLWLSTDVPADTTAWWVAAACSGLLAVILVILLWWLPRRRVEVVVPPLELLRQACAEAARSRDGKEAGARLSLALRTYAGAIGGFDGAGTTTRECLSRARSRLHDTEAVALGRLLDGLDGLRWSADDLALAAVDPLRQNSLVWAEGVQERLDQEAAAAAEAKQGKEVAA